MSFLSDINALPIEGSNVCKGKFDFLLAIDPSMRSALIKAFRKMGYKAVFGDPSFTDPGDPIEEFDDDTEFDEEESEYGGLCLVVGGKYDVQALIKEFINGLPDSVLKELDSAVRVESAGLTGLEL